MRAEAAAAQQQALQDIQSGTFIAGGGALATVPSFGTSTVATVTGVAQALNGAAAIGEGVAQLMAAAKGGGGASSPVGRVGSAGPPRGRCTTA